MKYPDEILEKGYFYDVSFLREFDYIDEDIDSVESNRQEVLTDDKKKDEKDAKED